MKRGERVNRGNIEGRVNWTGILDNEEEVKRLILEVYEDHSALRDPCYDVPEDLVLARWNPEEELCVGNAVCLAKHEARCHPARYNRTVRVVMGLSIPDDDDVDPYPASVVKRVRRALASQNK